MIASGLHPASQSGITGRQENPALRDGQDFAIGGSDGVRRRAGEEGGDHSVYALRSPLTICRAIGTRQHDFIAVEVTQPKLSVIAARRFSLRKEPMTALSRRSLSMRAHAS